MRYCGAGSDLSCRLDEFLAWKGQYEYFTRLRSALLWSFPGVETAELQETKRHWRLVM